jgi:hypothetical protein
MMKNYLDLHAGKTPLIVNGTEGCKADDAVVEVWFWQVEGVGWLVGVWGWLAEAVNGGGQKWHFWFTGITAGNDTEDADLPQTSSIFWKNSHVFPPLALFLSPCSPIFFNLSDYIHKHFILRGSLVQMICTSVSRKRLVVIQQFIVYNKLSNILLREVVQCSLVHVMPVKHLIESTTPSYLIN